MIENLGNYYFFVGIFILLVFLITIALNPQLLGTARAKQTSFSDDEIKNSFTFQKTQNKYREALQSLTGQ